MTIARLPHAGEAGEFAFPAGPVAGEMVRRMAGGSFTRAGRNLVFAGGDGTGKTRPAVAIARSCIRGGARTRVFDIIEPAGLSSGSSGTDARGASPMPCDGATSPSGRATPSLRCRLPPPGTPVILIDAGLSP